MADYCDNLPVWDRRDRVYIVERSGYIDPYVCYVASSLNKAKEYIKKYPIASEATDGVENYYYVYEWELNSSNSKKVYKKKGTKVVNRKNGWPLGMFLGG